MSQEKDDHQPPFTILVEGNIAAGKTQLLNYFQQYSNALVLQEPVSLWQNFYEHNLLDLSYKNPQKYGLIFQLYVTYTMKLQHEIQSSKAYKFMERSLYATHFCFTQYLVDTGKLDTLEFQIMDLWFKEHLRSTKIQADLIIYLRTEPNTALERIQSRARDEEHNVSLTYVEGMHEKYDNWLLLSQSLTPCPVLTVNANQHNDLITVEYQKIETMLNNCRKEGLGTKLPLSQKEKIDLKM